MMGTAKGRSMELILITACGGKKESVRLPAWRLYKSSRIKYLKKVSSQYGVPFYILSAKHGLIHSDTEIDPYDMVMTEERAKVLYPVVLDQLRGLKRKGVRIVLYYKGGARRTYFELLSGCTSRLSLNFIYYGSGNMKDIGLTPYFLERLGSVRRKSLFPTNIGGVEVLA